VLRDVTTRTKMSMPRKLGQDEFDGSVVTHVPVFVWSFPLRSLRQRKGDIENAIGSATSELNCETARGHCGFNRLSSRMTSKHGTSCA
jgi:hypothetical protein